MDPRILMFILSAFVFVAVMGAGYAILGRSDLKKRFRSHLVDSEKPEFKWQEFLKKSEGVLKPLGSVVPRSPEEMSRQGRRLTRAGIRRKDGSILLYGAKVLLAAVLVAVSIVAGLPQKYLILFILLSVFFGAILPDLWLNMRIRRRTDRIQLALPNALDLAVICVEAGLGLDQSLMRIGRELKRGFPELSDELNLLGIEINAGKKRADALRNLGNRSDSKDLKALTAVLIQTDRFGTSIAQSLRVFSESMRTTRRQRAEEHAAKMSIKMIPPLVFFIFPNLFLIILGPAVISILRNLGNLVK